MAAQLDWYGCSTLRFQVVELTVALDAYIARAANAPGTGLSPDAITSEAGSWADTQFDHLYGAERIRAETSAKLIVSLSRFES